MRRKKLNLNRDFYRDRCDEVVPDAPKEVIDDYQKTVDDIRDTLKGTKDLIALSAPQIGKKYRIFGMKFANNEIKIFMNPLIIERKKFKLVPEKQIGFDREAQSESFFVPRYDEIVVGYQKPSGVIEQNKFIGVASYVFEQMVQLLDGVFISDFGLPILEEWNLATQEEKELIIQDYFKWLDEQKIKLDEDLNKDEEFKRLTKLSEWYRDVILGKVELVK